MPLKIAYKPDGEISRMGTELGVLDPDETEMEVPFLPKRRLHHVVDGVVVERDAPLVDRVQAKRDRQATEREAIISDPIMNGLITRSPAEVFTWVENNVNDMATLKELVKRQAAAISWLLKKVM